MSIINVENRTIFCKDNIDILQGINSSSVDLIYLDPPFNKKKVFAAPIGSDAEGASFKDIFREEDVKDEWAHTIKEDNEKLYALLENAKLMGGRNSYNYCYLCYMGIRIIEMYRVLKDTGSIYLHCDQTMSHYLKLLMDCIFGESNFRNEVIWHYGKMANSPKNFAGNHDTIFRYSKTGNWIFNPIKEGDSEYRNRYINFLTGNRVLYKNVKHKKDRLILGRIKKIEKKLKRNIKDNDILFDFDKEYKEQSDVIYTSIIKGNSKERTGYPTQKPLALLEKIIEASSNAGDIVLDPFCGCATTCVAAEKLKRQWIGIDISKKAHELVKIRLEKEVYDNLFQPETLPDYQLIAPQRTDGQHDSRLQKWVYVISNNAFKNEYKVGVASSWKQRLNAYQTSDPNRGYKMEYKLQTPEFNKVEKYIHESFDSRHEWVNAELDNIKKEIKKFNNKVTGKVPT